MLLEHERSSSRKRYTVVIVKNKMNKFIVENIDRDAKQSHVKRATKEII